MPSDRPRPGARAAPGLILGLDPGSRTAGFALLRARGQGAVSPRDFAVVQAGVLRADPALPRPERLGLLHEALFGLLAEATPDVCVLEKAFVGRSIASALALGEVRGAFIAACARAGVSVCELTPAEVKKAIAGNGRAEKEQVSRALAALMGFERGGLPHDVTDALAIGLTHGLGAVLRA